MAVDIQKLFNEELPAQLAKFPDQAKQIGAKFQMNITGEGGGEWFIDASDTGPSVLQGQGAADVTMTIAAEDFQKLQENPQANGMALFFAGKIKMQGNQMLAMKLGKLFNLGLEAIRTNSYPGGLVLWAGGRSRPIPNFRVSRPNFKVSAPNSGARTARFKDRTASFEVRTANFGARTPNFGARTPNFGVRTPNSGS